MQHHPEIEIISRDRWSEYATEAQKGAPQARQVAVRWHVLHNLTESVSALFPRIRAELNPSGPTSKGKEPSSAQLDEEEQQSLSTLKQTSTTAEVVYHLVQDFGQMVRLRQGERLDEWLKKVETSAIPELQTFAAGIQRNKAAVQAGLTLSYSNGLLEGHMNRLKLIKRSMYGRAKFDLLRLRVLSSV